MSKQNPLLPTKHRARKRFGQNFLVDTGVIHQIIRSVRPQESDRLVEIGPGQGALTGPFLKANPSLQVIELDRDLIPVLLAQFANYQGFTIHQHDALSFDFTRLQQHPEERLRIVGNLPYNISTPLIFKLLETQDLIQDMHFMLQKEVVDRLIAGPGDKRYGRLSIMAQYHCQIDKLFEVPATCFDPVPKVISAVVRLAPYRERPVTAFNLDNLRQFVQTAFQQRRKTLRNGLKALVNDAEAARVGLDLSQRAENLSVKQYVDVSNALWGHDNIPIGNET